jgi:hypothetical protein
MHSKNPYLQFGLSGDWVASTALGLAALALLVALLPSLRRRLAALPVSGWLLGLALGAAGLSAGYVTHYLRGGPRIIDAAYYFLEARGLAHGHFVFPVPDPEASFSGRFLIPGRDAGSLAVLFPGGYPLLLALAVVVGAPLWLGPLLAALLVMATYFTARRSSASQATALAAAALSLLSAALRYHTADTMSHGLSALLVVCAVGFALGTTRRSALLSGACLGWLIFTRPVSGLASLLVLAWFSRKQRAQLGLLLLGLAPGVLLLAAQQHAVTGHFLGSTQLAYYHLADGPPGCFRYGFGRGIGCLFEHGDYVRARLWDGYGLSAALSNTLRRVLVHSLDIANAAPLALGVPLGVWLGRREPATRLLGGLVLGGVASYMPFYFEASFPGGGARLFADWLPLEHILLARTLTAFAWGRFAWPVSLAGFALHTSNQHQSLRDREGGRPMFEPRELSRRGITHGLVFVNTDHGFALGHDPAQRNATTGVVIARARDDALDRLLWEQLGRPPTYLYTYDARARDSEPSVTAYEPRPFAGARRIEAEHLWPPAAIRDGWAHPDYSALFGVSQGRGLALHATNTTLTVSLRLPAVSERLSSGSRFRLGWVATDAATEGPSQPPDVRAHWSGAQMVTVQPTWKQISPNCYQSSWLGPLPIAKPLEITLVSPSGLLDYIELRGREDDKGVDN